MTQLIFIAHMPLMRMKRGEDFYFDPSLCLTKLPWETYDNLTKGAFSDWQPKYVETDPVFVWWQKEVDLPILQPEGGPTGVMIEQRGPTATWPQLFPVMSFFHQHVVDHLWAALALAAPAGVPPPPRCSVTFVLPAGNATIEIGGKQADGMRGQGDADQELVYLADGASAPWNDEQLQRAAELGDVARTALDHDVLRPALLQLLGTGEVTLNAEDQMLLTVAAMENLLQPKARTGSGEIFARRVSNLLGQDDAHREGLFDIARDLYRRRSAVIHGNEHKRAKPLDLPPAVAQQLLAGAIEALATAPESADDMEALRRRLDEGGIRFAPSVELALTDPPGCASLSRLGPRKPWNAATYSSTGSLSSPKGTIVSWSPMAGLVSLGPDLAHPELGVHLTSMKQQAIVGMEEKDIRRDFIQNIHFPDRPVAALAVPSPHGGGMVDEATVQPLTRIRDLAVVGLRLVGFNSFIDPSLLGWYVYDGSIRHRRETVLRQSVITAMGSSDPAVIEESMHGELVDAWTLMANYDREARDSGIDTILDLFLRAHDRRFLPPQTRASLALICLEAMLGRFRSKKDRVQLEHLVSSLDGVAPASTAWFESEGRDFRNKLAHGKWNPDHLQYSEIQSTDHMPLLNLLDLCRAGVESMLRLWVDSDPPVRAWHGPARLLVRTLSKGLSDRETS